MRSPQFKLNQSGIGPVVAVAAIAALGTIMIVLVVISTSGSGSKNNDDTAPNDSQQQEDQAASNEPPYIRIPDNSKIYSNDKYKFSFAYPDSFGELTAKSSASSGTADYFQAESGLASQKPVGNGTASMNGRMGVFVYTKNDFKVVVNSQDVQVAPTVTGNDITWKIVSRGNSSQDLALGSSYSVKTIKSQTGIAVFDFTYKPSGSLAISRWVFAAGDRYIMVSLPSISKPSGDTLGDSDVSAYTIIGNNIAKTVRVTATTPSSDTDSSNSSEDTTN